jgi:hypothetical protein
MKFSGNPSINHGGSHDTSIWIQTGSENRTGSGFTLEVLCGNLFEAEGFGLPCTAWAGSGLLVKSRLIRIRADEGALKRTRSFEIELVLAAAGREIT